MDRALRLLVLLRQQGRISVTATARHLDVAPSTAHRLLSALCHRDFAVRDRDRQYRPGPELNETSMQPLSITALRRVARPALEWLHARTQETSHLMVLSGANVRFIDGVEGEKTLRVGLRTGLQFPAYCTSGGKAMLAAGPKARVDELHRDGLPPWPNARIKDLAQLQRHLTTIRRQRYAVNREESEQGIVAIGSCIRDDIGRPQAAVSVSIPSGHYRPADLLRYSEAVLHATWSVEASLFRTSP
ncbi:MAG: IclR family transcriptional regulator [Modestobacter sp.]|nr:IclR family transcriptional regulator [Modestobacter sp.]